MSNDWTIINEYLPFPIQRLIMEYAPRLPPLPSGVHQVFSLHYKKRICAHCGRFLPIENHEGKYYCLCRRKYRKVGWTSSSSPRSLQLFLRPKHIFLKPWISMTEYDRLTKPFLFRTKSHSWYYIVSRQPAVLFQFRTFLSSETLETLEESLSSLESFLPYFIAGMNTNTCLRSCMDYHHVMERLLKNTCSTLPLFFRQLSSESLYLEIPGIRHSFFQGAISYDHVYTFACFYPSWANQHSITFHQIAYHLLTSSVDEWNMVFPLLSSSCHENHDLSHDSINHSSFYQTCLKKTPLFQSRFGSFPKVYTWNVHGFSDSNVPLASSVSFSLPQSPFLVTSSPLFSSKEYIRPGSISSY